TKARGGVETKSSSRQMMPLLLAVLAHGTSSFALAGSSHTLCSANELKGRVRVHGNKSQHEDRCGCSGPRDCRRGRLVLLFPGRGAAAEGCSTGGQVAGRVGAASRRSREGPC